MSATGREPPFSYCRYSALRQAALGQKRTLGHRAFIQPLYWRQVRQTVLTNFFIDHLRHILVASIGLIAPQDGLFLASENWQSFSCCWLERFQSTPPILCVPALLCS